MQTEYHIYLLHQLLSANAIRRPDAPAVILGKQVVSYAELEMLSRSLACKLVELGAGPGERVGLHMHRSIFSIIAIFAVLKTGAAYVPIDPGSPPVRIGQIGKASDLSILITVASRLQSIEKACDSGLAVKDIILMDATPASPRALGSTRILHGPEIEQSATSAPPQVRVVDTDLAYILFTSGSTGSPKGVMISHRNALAFVASVSSLFGFTECDRFSHVCPTHSDMSVFDIFVAMMAGASVVVLPETLAMFPAKMAAELAHHRISVWNSVPSTLVSLATLTTLEAHDFSSLRLIAFAGEVFPVKYLRRLYEVVPSARFCNMYGQTEANTSLYWYVDDLPDFHDGSLPIGRPLPNFDVFAIKDDGAVATDPGDEGELYVRASTVAMGYLGDHQRTAQAFVSNPLRPETNERVYRTGDIVRMGSNAAYYFIGRRDTMVKSRGFRVEIEEIENLLVNHPAVSAAVVIPVPDDDIGNRLHAFVIPSHSPEATARELLDFCAANLPRYMVPETLQFKAALPTTSSGKIDRTTLARLLNS